MQMIGALLVTSLLAWLATMAVQLRRQFIAAKRQDELSLQLLQAQLEAASLLKSQRETAKLSWNGFRDFQVHGTVNEAKNITSLYLYPHDGKPLPCFQPGQSLTLRVFLPGEDDPIERSFPIASVPSSDYYRITVQRNPSDPVSEYLLKEVNQRTVLKVGAPRGEFCINPTLYRPLAMIADGVGVAPFVSMIESVAATNAKRSITLIHSVRNRDEHAMGHRLNELAEQHHNIRVVTVYEEPGHEDCCDHTGRVTVDLLRSVLNSNNFDFYVCGPDAMVKQTQSLLRRWGVSRWNLFAETVDGSSARTASKEEAAAASSAPSTNPVLSAIRGSARPAPAKNKASRSDKPEAKSTAVVSVIRNAMKSAAATPATKTVSTAAIALPRPPPP